MIRIGRLLPIVLLLVAVVGRADAQVDCTDPNNLCTGDPCVIPTIEVADPCTADFGTRTLVIAGTLNVPYSGDIDFTAATVRVEGQIVAPGESSVQLTATDDVVVTGRVQGRRPAGANVGLDAGGDVILEGRLDVSAGEGFSGSLAVDASGVVNVAGTILGDNAGVHLAGAQGVDVSGRIRAPALEVGTSLVELLSSTGGITIDGRISVPARHGETIGGDVEVEALGDIVLNGRVFAPSCGSTCVSFSSSSGDVILNGPVIAKRGGPIEVSAGQRAELNSTIDITGGTFGGLIDVEAAVVVVAPRARLDASKPPNGPAQAALCLRTTAGDLTLSGSFLARAMGAIVGTATGGDVIADGIFRVAPNGCVGFAADGMVDTSGGSFDIPPSPSCVSNCP